MFSVLFHNLYKHKKIHGCLNQSGVVRTKTKLCSESILCELIHYNYTGKVFLSVWGTIAKVLSRKTVISTTDALHPKLFVLWGSRSITTVSVLHYSLLIQCSKQREYIFGTFDFSC